MKPFYILLFQVGVHFGDIFYEFVPWNGVVEWEIAQWGYWHIIADNETHKVIMMQMITLLTFSLAIPIFLAVNTYTYTQKKGRKHTGKANLQDFLEYKIA